MEHIKNIEIKNFKSIRHAEIKDCRRVNVFIGYPNVGKSNILEGLGLYSINEPSLDFSSFVRIETLATIFFNGNIDENAEIKINDHHLCKIELLDDFLRIQRQYAKDAGSFDGTDSQQILRLYEFEIRESQKAITNFKEAKSPEMIFGHVLFDIKKYEFNSSASLKQGGYQHLSIPYGGNIFDVLSANSDIRKGVSDLFNPYDLKFAFDKATRTYRIIKNIGEDIFSVSYSMIADTLKRLIFYKTAIQSNNGATLLFEEPEAHMFAPYVSKFTSEIVSDENSNQYFIATHSPYVLNDLISGLDDTELAIYLVSYKKDSGETVIDKMSKEEMHEAYQFGYDFFMNLENFIPQA